jgi:two-component system LytT family sensor kinase
MIDDRLILITLLVKLGVSAAVSSVLARSRRFRVLLYHENRTIPEQLEMALFIAVPFALGVVVRHSVKNFLAADLTFEASILMGVLCGRLAGTAGGLMVSLPYLFTHNWVNLPVNVMAGLASGMLGNLAKDREAIWSFSPLFDLSIYRWIRRTIAKSFIDWQTSFFVTVLTLEFFKQEIEGMLPQNTFVLDSPHLAVNIAIYLTTVMCVAVSIKVLNNTRMEMKLEERDRLLLNARMEALQNQINPHFLFNTLNSVSSLVRFDPDAARTMVLKLANILRRLLRKGDSFVQLREEFEFIDDYLDIEVVRFGREKLKVVKELDPPSLEVMVPSVLLQPLVENAIKHGLSPKIEGGTIYLRSRVVDDSLVVEVEDDGVGIGGEPPKSPTTGIGLANVRERLHVLYGDNAKVEFESQPGRGTLVRLLLPIPQNDDYGMPDYDSRPNTAR